MQRIPEKPSQHKAKNLGYVRLVVSKPGEKKKYRQKYFKGPFGSVTMWDDFNSWRRRELGQVEADRSTLDQAARAPSSAAASTVHDICSTFLAVLTEQRQEGKPGQTLADRAAITQARLSVNLLAPFADMLADSFTAQHLREARSNEITMTGNSRKTINGKMATIVRIFRQAVADGRCAADTYGRLLALEKLGHLDKGVPGPEEVDAAPWADVLATIEAAPPTIACMIRIQAATGLRSANVCGMTWEQIDQGLYDTDGVWIYKPQEHKTKHLGKTLAAVLGPEAIQAILDYENIRPDRGHPFLFNPRATRSYRYYSEHLGSRCWQSFYKASKKTDLNPCFSTKTYCDAVQRVQRRIGIDRWTPHQLRHLHNQRLVESKFGERGAAAVLGHATLAMTRNYSTQDMALAKEAQKLLG